MKLQTCSAVKKKICHAVSASYYLNRTQQNFNKTRRQPKINASQKKTTDLF